MSQKRPRVHKSGKALTTCAPLNWPDSQVFSCRPRCKRRFPEVEYLARRRNPPSSSQNRKAAYEAALQLTSFDDFDDPVSARIN
jgi:hypothetical protein